MLSTRSTAFKSTQKDYFPPFLWTVWPIDALFPTWLSSMPVSIASSLLLYRLLLHLRPCINAQPGWHHKLTHCRLRSQLLEQRGTQTASSSAAPLPGTLCQVILLRPLTRRTLNAWCTDTSSEKEAYSLRAAEFIQRQRQRQIRSIIDRYRSIIGHN